MNYKLILCSSIAIFVFGTLTICLVPNINENGEDWKHLNCQIICDDYNLMKKYIKYPNDIQELAIENKKKERNFCNRKSTMNDLEYPSLIISIIVGVVCSIIAILTLLEENKMPEKKYLGLAFMCAGAVCFILSFIYIVFSIYIFANDRSENIKKLYDNGASYQWDNSKKEYVEPYDSNDTFRYEFVKFKDLGKKQYNYNSQNTRDQSDVNSEFYNCNSGRPANMNKQQLRFPDYQRSNTYCDYIWEDTSSIYSDDSNKNLYDKWLSSIIFGFFTVLGNLSLGIFGLILFFKKSEE